MDLAPHINRMRSRFSEVESLLSSPNLYDNPQQAQEITREHARLKDVVAECDLWEKAVRELEEAKSMLAETSDPDLKSMAEDEIRQLNAQMEKATFSIKAALLPPDEADSRNTIVEIRAGTGGTEAALFGADLYRMYCRYAERVGWKTETIEASPGDLGGYKEIIFQINGTDVYKLMRFESGVHRVQRVPATEAQGRIHTSTSTVAVLPEAKEVDIVIKPDDLRIEVCRSGGPGGQGVNTTDSAVQVMHIPTGIIVRCQDGRSQLKNREKALSILRSRLLKARKEEEEAKYAQNRRSQIGSGERHEKIRTYNYPQNRITDHRINHSLHNLPDFMDGNLQPMFNELVTRDIEERLALLGA